MTKNNWSYLQQFNIDPSIIDENTTIIMGFTGYGSVGTLSTNHIIEMCDVNSVGFLGGTSWFYNDNLETPITVYSLNVKSKKVQNEKFIIISSRLPLPVVGYNALPDAFWSMLIKEILSWKAKRYIIFGGLREEFRSNDDETWITLVPTPKYSELYGTKRTFKERLSIKGPLHFLLTEGTAANLPVLAIMSYCNIEEDTDAALLSLKELEHQLGVDLHAQEIAQFDSSFLETEVDLFETDMDEDYEDFEDEDEEFEEDDFHNYSDTNRESDGKFFSSSKFFKDYKRNGDDLEKYK